MRWLLYGLGGGMGHLQRSLALARAAVERGVECAVLTNSPWRRSLAGGDIPSSTRDWLDQVRLVEVATDADTRQAATAFDLLLEEPWDVLVVDTFPRGLGGELAERLDRFPGRKVWTHRDISPRYLESIQAARDWAPQFDLILAPGERGPLAELAVETPPWLLLPSDRLLPRAAARQRFGVAGDEPLAIVVAGGKRHEPQVFAELAQRLRAVVAEVRLVSLQPIPGATPRWPLLNCLTAADLIVGAGGYNTVHEADSLGVPLLGIAQPRMYDRQQRRLGARQCSGPAELLQRASRLAPAQTQPAQTQPAQTQPAQTQPAAYPDGAAIAARRILELF